MKRVRSYAGELDSAATVTNPKSKLLTGNYGLQHVDIREAKYVRAVAAVTGVGSARGVGAASTEATTLRRTAAENFILQGTRGDDHFSGDLESVIGL